MTLYDLINELFYNNEELTNILIQLDNWLEYLHSHGFCIIDFNPQKIILYNGKFTFDSFRNVLGFGYADNENAKKINIFQENKIGLMAYNHMPIDGNMNQEHFNFLQDNLEEFNKQGNIPEEIYEYYEEIFRRLNVCYMNDYLVKKQQERKGNQNTSVKRKTLSTEVGRAYAQEDNAFVNVLFIPTLITFVYLLGLFIYTFIIK